MRPANLPLFQRQAVVSPPAITDDDPANRLAQELGQAASPAMDMDHEERHLRRRRRPEPTPGPGLLPAGLVGVLHRGVADCLTSLVVRRDQRGAGLLLQGDDRAQRHRDLVDGLDELLDRAFAEMETSAEVAHVRRQSRPEDMGADLGGDSGLVERATAGAGSRVGLMLGDDGGLFGEFGDLMPGGLGIVGTGLARQRGLASRANRGDVGDDFIDATGRQANSVMAAMASLSSGPSSGGRLGERLGSVEGIDRGGRGAIGRVALDLEEEFLDLSFEHDDPGRGPCRVHDAAAGNQDIQGFRAIRQIT